MIVGDHDRGPVAHQFPEGLSELPVLLEVVLHPLRHLLLGHRSEHRAAVVVLVDLVPGEEDQVRIVGDHLGDGFLPRPGDVLVTGQTGQLEPLPFLWLGPE